MGQDPYLPDGWSQQRIDKHYGHDQDHEYDAELDCINIIHKDRIVEVEISYFYTDRRVRDAVLEHDYPKPCEVYGLKTCFELDYDTWNEKPEDEIFTHVYDNLIDW